MHDDRAVVRDRLARVLRERLIPATWEAVGALTVTENDELMLITTKGQMVRTRVKEIRAVGRNTMGVKLMDLKGAEKLQAIAPVVSQEGADVESDTAPTPAA